MSAFIQGTGSISPQQLDFDAPDWGLQPGDPFHRICREPDYRDLIPPMQLRRMTKVVRIGVAAAKAALRDAGLERPDLITTGTAYGCLADTELFLGKLLTQDESMLTPTAFIQSTHNTVSGQIALMTACHGHNFTYVHRGHSFEAALQEALLWSAEQPELNILTGGIDELTPHAVSIIRRFGTYADPQRSAETQRGAAAGEGAGIMILSGQKKATSLAEIVDVELCIPGAVEPQLQAFLQRHGVQPGDIGLFLNGLSGDPQYDEPVQAQLQTLAEVPQMAYKAWCGEYPTAGSFAVVLAALMLNKQQVPGYAGLAPQTILVHQHYKNDYHSFTLLRRA